MLDKIINNDLLYPRSEFHSRFEDTTAFDMAAAEYWNTYHRSEKTRYFKKAGSRKAAHIDSPCVNKTDGAHSFYSHTGCVASQLTIEEYADEITLKKQTYKNNTTTRDDVLLYKRQMVRTVVSAFNELCDNKQSVKGGLFRPIVFEENNYPCVLVQLPVINSNETDSPVAAYWAAHPKPFQKLLIAIFVALLNAEAYKASIPIEMVLRASFGHNLPSICETNNTFRINVGIIPKCYAELIAVAISKLNSTVKDLMDNPPATKPFDDTFHDTVRKYNASKLKNAITVNGRTGARYKELPEEECYKNAADSDTAFSEFYKKFKECNASTELKGKKRRFSPVKLKEKNIWEVLCATGDSMGKSVLYECFRENKTVDWFADILLNELLKSKESIISIELVLSKLLNNLEYSGVVSMQYSAIDKDLKKKRHSFKSNSFASLYRKDKEFNEITAQLFSSFGAKRPQKAIYSALDRAASHFIQTARGSRKVSSDADYGSDSAFSADLASSSDEEQLPMKHKKLRVCSGMKAIVLAQYGALAYFNNEGKTTFSQDIDYTYYEVPDALKAVKAGKLKWSAHRAKSEDKILHYDLNYCNATNQANTKSLRKKLQDNPRIVVLDYTSSTHQEMKAAIKHCLLSKSVDLIMLVCSGLKNDQGGLDYNPYGEVRVIARDKKTRDWVLNEMQKGLAEEDKLPVVAHELVRACKNKGLATSLYQFFNNNHREDVSSEEEGFVSDQNKLDFTG